jgi:hypothetical protein
MGKGKYTHVLDRRLTRWTNFMFAWTQRKDSSGNRILIGGCLFWLIIGWILVMAFMVAFFVYLAGVVVIFVSWGVWAIFASPPPIADQLAAEHAAPAKPLTRRQTYWQSRLDRHPPRDSH